MPGRTVPVLWSQHSVIPCGIFAGSSNWLLWLLGFLRFFTSIHCERSPHTMPVKLHEPDRLWVLQLQKMWHNCSALLPEKFLQFYIFISNSEYQTEEKKEARFDWVTEAWPCSQSIVNVVCLKNFTCAKANSKSSSTLSSAFILVCLPDLAPCLPFASSSQLPLMLVTRLVGSHCDFHQNCPLCKAAWHL